MRSKFTTALLLVLLCFSLFGQNAKSRSEFFKEFYGTLINPSGLEIPAYESAAPTVDLSDVIKQLESRYNIDIPAEEEAKFQTVEEVAEYVNLYLQKQTKEFETDVIPQDVTPIKPMTDKKPKSWKLMLYGSYGLTEPLGVTGNLGWNGNLGGAGAFDISSNMYTWETGIMIHPYGWTGKPSQRPNAFGFAFDYASFDYLGVHDTTMVNYNANDTTATRYAVSMVFRQNLIGRKKDRPKLSFYFEESIRLGVHSFGFINSDLNWNNHLSMGVGLAQGINFLIFDLKCYQIIAYSPDIVKVTGYSIINSLDYEVGLRLGIALKL